MTVTEPCPPPDVLRKMLDDELDAAEGGVVESHVSACRACQDVLERITRPATVATLWAWSEPEPIPPEFGARTREGDTVELDRDNVPGDPGTLPEVPGYIIERELGRGGMGVVYLARQAHANRLVALKMVQTGRARPEDLLRFQIEAESLARLRHPNIVQVHEVGAADGRPFFTMEYVEGGTLADTIAAGPTPPREAATLILTIASAVHAAHQCGVIHRDLKPANILIPGGRDATGQASTVPGIGSGEVAPKVTDFGLAKQVGDPDGLTRTGQILGTPEYMAPEQATGGAGVGVPADVFALGAILYELLAGRPPFRSDSPWETMMRLVHEPALPPSHHRPGIPRDLEIICLKCLEKDPRARYPSADAQAEDLRRFLANRPILAQPAGPARRVVMWCRRRPAAAALCALLAGSIAAGTVGVTIQWLRAEHEKSKARTFNAWLQDALKTTQAAQGQAEENAQLALDAHRELVGRVQTLLQETPETRKLRKSLLETAAAGLQRVAGSDAGGPRVSRAMAHRLLGEVQWELGKSREAIEEMGQSRDIAVALLADRPESADAWAALATAQRRLSSFCLRMDDQAAARRWADEAVASAESWRECAPDDPHALDAQLEGDEQLAHTALWARDMPTARTVLDRLRDRSEARLAADPDDELASRILAATLSMLADIDEGAGDLRAARDKCRRSLELILADEQKELARNGRKTAVGRTLRGVMVCLNNLAGLHIQLADFAGARPLMDAALARAREWAASDPEDVQRQLDLIDTLCTRAALEQQDLKHPEALPYLDECLSRIRRLQEAGKLVDRPMYSDERREYVERAIDFCRRMPAVLEDDEAAWSASDKLAYALTAEKVEILLASGRSDAAAATARGLPRREPSGPAGWMDVARICSRAAQAFEGRDDAPSSEVASALLDRGLMALGRVFELSTNPPSADDLAKDPRLSALRRASGYADLIARQSGKAKPNEP